MTPEDVLAIARAANLPLSPERVELVRPILSDWLNDGAELSRKMSADTYRDTLPITTFAHSRRS